MEMVDSDPDAIKICSDLQACRRRLLLLFSGPRYSPDAIESEFNMYLSLLHGLLMVPGENTPSKMRHSVLFWWTHSLLGNAPQLEQDCMYEVANMSCNVAFWYMKRASEFASKYNITMKDAEEVQTSLRKAAGIFKLIECEFIPKLTERQMEATDLDPRVISAYLTQCTAEAQEVTLARAVELKHDPSLISALANETFKLFSDAAGTLDPLGYVASQWTRYLRLRLLCIRHMGRDIGCGTAAINPLKPKLVERIFENSAYCVCGENLLGEDRCGEAVHALQESQACCERSIELCKEYAKTKGPARIHLENHSFFRRLAPRIRKTLEECEQKNKFGHLQKVPDAPPELELKATYGLVSSSEVPMISPSPLWTPVSYAAFDIPKTSAKDPANSKAAAEVGVNLPPVPEVNVYQTILGSNTSSGCILQ